VKAHKDELLIVALYADDLIFVGNNQRLIDEFKKTMKLEFEMTDLRMMRYFIGLEIKQERSGIFVSQGAYAREILQKFCMHDCNPVATPMELGAKLSKLEGGEAVDSNTYRSIIESLRYLTCTRPDIAFVVWVASRFMEDPRHSHLKATRPDIAFVVWVVSRFMEDPRHSHLKAMKKILRYVKRT
jgi:Reverse transcriptase (RNA-dependent DNA polymerase)